MKKENKIPILQNFMDVLADDKTKTTSQILKDFGMGTHIPLAMRQLDLIEGRGLNRVCNYTPPVPKVLAREVLDKAENNRTVFAAPPLKQNNRPMQTLTIKILGVPIYSITKINKHE